MLKENILGINVSIGRIDQLVEKTAGFAETNFGSRLESDED